MGKCENWNSEHGAQAYFVFRVLLGLLFFMHGAQKLFGWFGGSKVPSLVSAFGVAGVLEVVIGLAVVLGLYTRLAATLAAVEMMVAFIWIHLPNGWNPLANYGEPAVLYFAAFLALTMYGAGKWSLERKLTGKEVF